MVRASVAAVKTSLATATQSFGGNDGVFSDGNRLEEGRSSGSRSYFPFIKREGGMGQRSASRRTLSASISTHQQTEQGEKGSGSCAGLKHPLGRRSDNARKPFVRVKIQSWVASFGGQIGRVTAAAAGGRRIGGGGGGGGGGGRVLCSELKSSCCALSSRNGVGAFGTAHSDRGSVPPCHKNEEETRQRRSDERRRSYGGDVSVRASATEVAEAAMPGKIAELREVIELLLQRENLTEQQAQDTMEGLLAGAEPAQMSAFLVLLRAKGETPEEVSGLAKAMRQHCIPVAARDDTLDIVGTGGDGANTVNISTGACVLAAACGAKVAKHGNRSVSSVCGSGDVLEALGVSLEIGPESVARCINEVGVGFMFAPRFHPAMRVVAPVRKALKVRTVFNILGPMLNPSMAPYSLVGVFNQALVELMAKSLQRLDTKRALVVHSQGLDEISPMGPADIVQVTPTSIETFRFDPVDYGIKRCSIEDLKGGDKETNATLLRETFAGKTGPIADALIVNAGVGLVACGVAKDVGEGVARASEVHQSGKALQVLNAWVKLSQDLRKAEEEATSTS